MAVRSLVQCLERLTLAPTLSRTSQLSYSASSTLSHVNCGHVFTQYFRSFHTTSICDRVLNRRMHPINREPGKKGRWSELIPFSERYEYTVRPLPKPKTGGRGPNGHIWNWRSGGGNKRLHRMVDYQRCVTESSSATQERVQSIRYDPNRSANIALVAGGENKRYIIATVNMKKGDVLTSSRELFDTPIRAGEGDAYPVGSLSIGTVVNCLETFPGEGGTAARAAGTQAQIIRKVGDQVILRLPSKRDVSIINTCMATVGRVGNIAHNQIYVGKAGRNRWNGKRPRSGFFQKKTGRFGRKIKPPKPVAVFSKAREHKPIIRRLPYDMLPKTKKPALKSSLH